MTGRHSAGGVPALKSQLFSIVAELNRQIQTLINMKADIRTEAGKILMLHTLDQSVMIAGGSLMNNFPDAIDEMIADLRLHIENLERYVDHIL